ncbi:hypothetical protein H0H81_010341, partial [Sphagnurus paluster]
SLSLPSSGYWLGLLLDLRSLRMIADHPHLLSQSLRQGDSLHLTVPTVRSTDTTLVPGTVLHNAQTPLIVAMTTRVEDSLHGWVYLRTNSIDALTGLPPVSSSLRQGLKLYRQTSGVYNAISLVLFAFMSGPNGVWIVKYHLHMSLMISLWLVTMNLSPINMDISGNHMA